MIWGGHISGESRKNKKKDMKTYLVNKTGAIVEYVAHPTEIRKLIRAGEYRRARASERVAFLEEKEEFLRNERHPGMYDVLYVAPRQGTVDGYGVVQDALTRFFVENGVFLNTFDRGQKVVLVHNYPHHLKPYRERDVLLYTMFETTKFPDDWGELFRMSKKVFFPAKFLQDIADRQFGIKSEVIPHGIAVGNFPFLLRNRGKNDTFTFLHYDAFKYRKGWDIVLNAFDDEFTESENVRLIFKTTYDAPPITLKAYENVSVICGKVSVLEMRKILSEADCFVFPTRGEGFGMTPLEALASGMPAIVPDAFGVSEYFDSRYCMGVDTILEKARYDNIELKKSGDLGYFKTPTIQSVRMAMREAFERWKVGNWATQKEEESREISEYAKKFSLEAFAGEMSKRVKEHCRSVGVEPEK